MRSKWVFLLVPLVYLTIAFTYIHLAGLYYAGGVDPEYNYLFNGITLAHFKLHLNGVLHPGTPIQVLIAVVARVVHFFRPGTLWDDVMLNPELYIKATVYTGNSINALFLFLLGSYVYKYTTDLVPSLVLQLSPFAFLMTLEVSYRLLPEMIMISIVSVWIIVLVKLLYEAPEKRNYKRYSIIFGLLFGFSLATKLTFIPFFVLPLFILPDIKTRLGFFGLSALVFFVIAFPVLYNFNKFTSWVTDIFIHKGAYGSGERGIVDWQSFLGNMKIILKSSPQLWIPVIISGFVAFTNYKRRKDIIIRMLLGVFFVVLIHFMITAKHYAFYYLTPSLLLTVFIFFLIYHWITISYPGVAKRKIPETLLIIAVIILIFNVIPKMNRQMMGLQERKKMHNLAVQTFEPFLNTKNKKIICASYYGCTPIEYALHFGLLESGRYGRELTAEYKKHYPSTILYMHWLDRFYDGVYQLDPKEFLSADTVYTLFIADHSTEMLQKITKMLGDTSGFKADLKLLEEFNPKAEAIYEFKLNNRIQN